MLDGDEFDRWVDAAMDAVAGAQVQSDAQLPHWACFLAEQAAQLACKGLLHGVGAEAWGHDLVSLGDRVSEALGGPLDADVRAALRRLSRHYIPARYPDAHPAGSPRAHYGSEDAAEAITDVGRIIAAVGTAWDQLVQAVGERPSGEDGP